MIVVTPWKLKNFYREKVTFRSSTTTTPCRSVVHGSPQTCSCVQKKCFTSIGEIRGVIRFWNPNMIFEIWAGTKKNKTKKSRGERKFYGIEHLKAPTLYLWGSPPRINIIDREAPHK